MNVRETPLENLELSRRTYNALKRSGIDTVGDLLYFSKIQILNLHNIGEKSISEIERSLRELLNTNNSNSKMSEISSVRELFSKHQEKYRETRIDTFQLEFQGLIGVDEPIILLELSPRVFHSLERAEIKKISQLVTLEKEKLLRIKGVGRKALKEIETKLDVYLSKSKSHIDKKQYTSSNSPSVNRSDLTVEEMIAQCLDILKERNQRIIHWRFGLEGDLLPLEEIGRRLGITRERVRQIEFASLRKLRISRRIYFAKSFINDVTQTLESNGGLVSEIEMVSLIKNNEKIKLGNIRLIGVMMLLSELTEKFRYYKREHYFASTLFPINEILNIQSRFLKILEKNYAPTQATMIIENFKKTNFYQKRVDILSDDFLLACLRVHSEIEEREHGVYTLKKWANTLIDEIILALREIGEPAHYSVISDHVNKLLPKENRASTHSIHATLQRRNDLFAWVGLRGTYGLKEWGLEQALFYEDALVQILSTEGCPLSFQEILAKMPEVRPYYEESSIMLTLGTNSRFKQFGGSTYGLSDWEEDQMITKDYRLHRLFSDVELPPKPQQKPDLMESLDSVDSFITKARGVTNSD